VSRPPDFDELVGGEELSLEERARLQLAHDLLVRAGPPPELPPALAEPPATGATVRFLPRRRRIATLLVAAALLLVAFGGGYLVAHHGRGSSSAVAFTVKMHGTSRAPGAVASLQVLEIDEAGNWPMLMRVRGLKALPRNGYYELFLTRNGKLGPPCGTFRVHDGTTEVPLNAPYRLKRFDGWVVTRHVPGRSVANEPLLTT
jgi:hypothetical protein